jgi:O-antigen/teichoic acid export membrane protein
MFTNKDLVWGVAAQGLSVGLWLVMLPAVLHYLPPAQVALWLVFVTLVALTQLLELGFQPTLARNVAFVYAGTKTLRSTGVTKDHDGILDPTLLASLQAASRLIYRRVSLSSAAMLWLGGTAYIVNIVPADVEIGPVVWAWIAFSSSQVLNLWFGHLNAFLHGRGDLLLANQAIVLSRLVQLVLGVALIVSGGGLMALGLAALVGAICGRWVALRFVALRNAELKGAAPVTAEMVRSLVRVIWPNASRYGLVLLAAFMITRANTLVATSRVGLIEAAGFALAVQILLTLQSLATLPYNLALPKLNQMRAQAAEQEMRSLFGGALVRSLGLFVIAAAGLVLTGPTLLRLVGSNTDLPGTGLMLALSLVMLLDLNHGLCANLITTDNRVPFVSAWLITGAGIVSTAWLVAPVWGVAGIVAGIALWQAAHNNWRWPREAARSLGTSYATLISDAVRSAKRTSG